MEFIAYLLIVTIISIVRSAPNQHHLIDNSDIKTFNYGNFQMRTKLTTFTLANGGIYGAVVDIVQVITDEAPKGFGSHVTTGTFAVEGVEHLPTVDQFLTDSYPLLNNLSLTPAHHGVFMISTKDGFYTIKVDEGNQIMECIKQPTGYYRSAIRGQFVRTALFRNRLVKVYNLLYLPVEFEMMIARMDAHEDSNSNLHSQITVLLVDSFTEALVAFLSINNFHYPDGREYGSAYLSELYDFRPHLPQVEVDPYFNLPADLKKICR